MPPTTNGILAKEILKVCKEELKESNLSITVQERGGRRLGSVLGVTVPGRSQRESCSRATCFPCSTGSVGVCRKTGVGNEIQCVVCENNNIVSKYAGESGRNLFTRGNEYVKEVEKKIAEKKPFRNIF